MVWMDEYKKKLINAEDAASMVKSGMWLDYGFGSGMPILFDEKLAERAVELKDVKVRFDWHCSTLKVLEVGGDHFYGVAWFVTHQARKLAKEGLCSYVPHHFGQGGPVYKKQVNGQTDIAIIEVSPMGKDGCFSFGAGVAAERAACDAAKMVIVEVNETQPTVNGITGDYIHISDVDYIIENDKYSIDELKVPSPTDTEIIIAKMIAEQLEDGSTLQLGVGPIPNTVCQALIERGAKDFGIHTEMFTAGMVDLIEAGVVTGKKKTINWGKSVCTFAAGSRKVYDFIDRNPMVLVSAVEYTNNPYIISQNYKQVSINNAIKIDLTGQVDAESIGTRQVSGTGGQLEYHRGAQLSPGGKAYIALPSTYTDSKGDLVSNIVPTLNAGDVVTDPRTDVSCVITEYGCIDLVGRSIWERVRLLVSIAHPKFRDELMEQAFKLNYMSKQMRGLVL